MNKIKNYLITAFLIIGFFESRGQSDSLQFYYTKAKEAQKQDDHPAFYQLIKKAYGFHPYHPSVLYNAALASTLNGQTDEALNFLTQAIHINAKFNLDAPEWKSLTSLKGFSDLKAIQLSLLKPVIHSDTAFVVTEKDLHIECISTGEKPGVFYLGSIHKRKIIKCDESGNCTDFTKPSQDGLSSVFGIKVDKKRNLLWACSSPMREMENYDSLERSAVFKYDLSSKKLIEKYYPSENREYVFGDIILDTKGKVYVSDSKNNIVFTVSEENKTLEAYYTSKEFWNIQGLTLNSMESTLFISDYVKGIYSLDLKTKALVKLSKQFDLSLKSVDGLTFYNGSLIAIQNGITPMRVTLYNLNEKQNTITGFKIIDGGHPSFNEPTIGCLRNNDFYYVANSAWSGYDKNHQLIPEKLKDVVILNCDLRKMK